MLYKMLYLHTFSVWIDKKLKNKKLYLILYVVLLFSFPWWKHTWWRRKNKALFDVRNATQRLPRGLGMSSQIVQMKLTITTNAKDMYWFLCKTKQSFSSVQFQQLPGLFSHVFAFCRHLAHVELLEPSRNSKEQMSGPTLILGSWQFF